MLIKLSTKKGNYVVIALGNKGKKEIEEIVYDFFKETQDVTKLQDYLKQNDITCFIEKEESYISINVILTNFGGTYEDLVYLLREIFPNRKDPKNMLDYHILYDKLTNTGINLSKIKEIASNNDNLEILEKEEKRYIKQYEESSLSHTSKLEIGSTFNRVKSLSRILELTSKIYWKNEINYIPYYYEEEIEDARKEYKIERV